MQELAVKAFMYRYGMSIAALAEYLDVNKTLVTNKLNPAYRNKLSQEEKEGILAYFKELHQHLGEFLDTDMNELPAALREAE